MVVLSNCLVAFCVVALLFLIFRWCKGHCHRTDSDLFLFILVVEPFSFCKIVCHRTFKKNMYLVSNLKVLQQYINAYSEQGYTTLLYIYVKNIYVQKKKKS